MNVHEAIRIRRSVRVYQDKPVPEDVLKRILEAARLAPSGNNHQSRKFVVVTDRIIKEKLAQAAKNQSFVAEAPVVIAAVGLNPEKIMSCGIQGDPVDVAISADHMTLAAVEEGLGTCWIGAFLQDQVCGILNIPKPYRVITLLTLGYPADTSGSKNRKSLGEVVCYQQFSL